MSRIINPEGAGKERTRLTRSVVLALRELMQQQEPDQETRDLAAFIVLALDSIAETIDVSVGAWEKRGYWLKADRFRMEWAWSAHLGEMMRKALLEDNWPQVAMTAAQVGEKLQDVKVPKRHNLGTPWIGAWNHLQQKH